MSGNEWGKKARSPSNPSDSPRTGKLVISHFSGKPGGSQPLTLLTWPTLTSVDVSKKKKKVVEDKVFRNVCKVLWNGWRQRVDVISDYRGMARTNIWAIPSRGSTHRIPFLHRAVTWMVPLSPSSYQRWDLMTHGLPPLSPKYRKNLWFTGTLVALPTFLNMSLALWGTCKSPSRPGTFFQLETHHLRWVRLHFVVYRYGHCPKRPEW